MPTDYELYRGKCKEFCEAAIKADPTLRLVRGHYWCPVWNTKEPHWWCVDTDGDIVDPTAAQFGSKGYGDYIEFDGNIECEECGKIVPEEEAVIMGNGHTLCSDRCACLFVGLEIFN